ncbi:hypothetical protein SK128_008570, partial [Halocaridina rubra]
MENGSNSILKALQDLVSSYLNGQSTNAPKADETKWKVHTKDPKISNLIWEDPYSMEGLGVFQLCTTKTDKTND